MWQKMTNRLVRLGKVHQLTGRKPTVDQLNLQGLITLLYVATSELAKLSLFQGGPPWHCDGDILSRRVTVNILCGYGDRVDTLPAA